MKRIKILAGILLLAFVTTNPAHARRHSVSAPAPSIFTGALGSDVANYAARSVDTPRRRYAPYREYRQRHHTVTVARVDNRPSECYGIAWCGCYLRHYLGIGDKSLNLAINWAGVGHAASPHSGTIVVWRHHVGLMKSEPDASGRAIVLSGNDGGAARERLRSIRRAVAFRRV